MKHCGSCAQLFEADGWRCSHCGHEPPRKSGFVQLAPDFRRETIGFQAEFFEQLAALEPSNFWFKTRNRLLAWALRAYFPQARSLLEIGCGTGFVLMGLRAAFPSLKLVGSEVLSEGLQFAARRVPDAELVQMDATRIPYADEFDVVGAFDMLEHIEEDEAVLKQMFRAVKPGGGVIVTVPQHKFLWSRVDELSGHVRRYTRRQLRDKVEAAGFQIERITSFAFLPLPLMYVARLSKRTEVRDLRAELRIGGVTNAFLEALLRMECVCIRAGVSLPVGGSLLLIARRPAVQTRRE